MIEETINNDAPQQEQPLEAPAPENTIQAEALEGEYVNEPQINTQQEQVEAAENEGLNPDGATA
jgi:hypothetical protein